MHLESFSVVQLVSPVATEEPQSEREEQTSSIESDDVGDDDDDSIALRYFAVSLFNISGAC